MRNLGGFFMRITMNNPLIKYLKPALSFQAQLEKLQAKGLIINNWPSALQSLSNTNYYRLSAYCLPFKRSGISGNITEQFQDKVTFENVIDLYEFDRKLRLLIMDGLERIEISVRTSIAYHLAHSYGPFALSNPQNFHQQFEHSSWLTQINNEIERSREYFIEHYKNKYLGYPNLPVWMAIEVLSFGSLSVLFKGLKNEDKRIIAEGYKLHPKTLANWLYFLTYVRNICAHHSRLWNKDLAIKPKIDAINELWLPPITPRNDRSYIILLIIKKLLTTAGNGIDWAISSEKLIQPIVEKYNWAHESMGIPRNWIDHPLWREVQ
ncbi:abi-like protein [Legionella pneumophila]|nr:abi-like protein [Legionella pneumophila]